MSADRAQVTTITEMTRVVRALADTHDGRLLLGLCGPPGTGKTTVAVALRDALGPDRAVVVQLDGFHLASNIIAGTDLAARRGAIDTFDAASFAVLVERLRAGDEQVVYAPTFERDLEEPINASLAVTASHDIVIVEGNYLLADGDAWVRVRACLDETWYLDSDPDQRVSRLVARHVASGKEPDVAADWVERSDEVNAQLIATTRDRADRILAVRMDDDELRASGRLVQARAH